MTCLSTFDFLSCSKYPEKRSIQLKDDSPKGVAGTVELINNDHVADQPVGAFDWSPDKLGLCAFAGFDQCVRVGLVTRLNTI